MTAKVASPAVACRGLGMQRSVKSQALTLHRGPIVLHSQSIANPHKARAFSCLCLFHLAVDAAGFTSHFYFCSCFFFTFYLLYYCSFVDDFHRIICVCCLCQACVFPSCQCAEVYIQPGSLARPVW